MSAITLTWVKTDTGYDGDDEATSSRIWVERTKGGKFILFVDGEQYGKAGTLANAKEVAGLLVNDRAARVGTTAAEPVKPTAADLTDEAVIAAFPVPTLVGEMESRKLVRQTSANHAFVAVGKPVETPQETPTLPQDGPEPTGDAEPAQEPVRPATATPEPIPAAVEPAPTARKFDPARWAKWSAETNPPTVSGYPTLAHHPQLIEPAKIVGALVGFACRLLRSAARGRSRLAA